MFDEKTSKVNALIDVDTIMPGTILYDFGDMVRSFANPQEEDNISDVRRFSTSIYECLLKGYSTIGKDFLSSEELEQLPFSVLVVSLIQGIRFLTDYMNHDIYYQVHHAEHNLHRAINQLRFYKESKTYLGIRC